MKILDIIFNIFDLFVMIVFMNRMLNGRRQNLNLLLYIIIFSIVDIVPIQINDLFPHPLTIPYQILVTIINIIAFSILCFLHNGTIKQYILTVISLELLLFVSDHITTLIVNGIIHDLSSLTEYQISIISLLCEMIFFLLVIIITSFRKRFKNNSLEYNILLLTTPIISIILLTLTSINDMLFNKDFIFYFFYILCFIILNVVNFIMLEKSSQYNKVKQQNENMQQQINIQREKYKQLNFAYRDTRRIVHDTNKHYLAIQEFINNKDYDKLSGYIYNATNSLNSTYIKFNSGNLVIDSFLTYYEQIANENNITFKAEVSINPDKVPLNEYDLCVILGNLLDNGIDACKNITGSDRYLIVEVYQDSGNRFIIHTSNPYTESKHHIIDENNHGYGLENIKRTTEANNGNVYIKDDDLFEVFTVVPIL